MDYDETSYDSAKEEQNDERQDSLSISWTLSIRV